jgi:hypothetical protein
MALLGDERDNEITQVDTLLPDHKFSPIEGFSVSVWRSGFDAAQPKERIECIFREPLPASLGGESFHKQLNFGLANGVRKRHI